MSHTLDHHSTLTRPFQAKNQSFCLSTPKNLRCKDNHRSIPLNPLLNPDSRISSTSQKKSSFARPFLGPFPVCPESDDKQADRLTFKDIQNITKKFMKDRKAHESNVGVLQNIKGKMYCMKLGQVANFKQFSHYFYASQYRRKYSKAQGKKELIDGEIQKFIQKINRQVPTQMLPEGGHKKINTQPEQKPYPIREACQMNLVNEGNNKYEAAYTQTHKYFDDDSQNQEEMKNLQKIRSIEELQLDQKVREKVNKFVLPALPVLGTSNLNKQKEANKKDQADDKQKLTNQISNSDKNFQKKLAQNREQKAVKPSKQISIRKQGRRFSVNKIL